MAIQLEICLGKNIKVVFSGIIIIIGILIVPIIRKARPNNFSKMVPLIPVPSSTKDQVQFFILVIGGESSPVEVVIQPSSSDQIRGIYGLPILNKWCYPIGFHIIILSILFKVTFPWGVVQRQIGIPGIRKFLVPMQLKMILFIIVHLVVIKF